MIRIICAKCKNAYLKKEEGNLICPSCEAVFPEADENLLLGAQYYNEGEYDKCDDCLMKYIVKAGAEPTAIFYKALCDGFRYNEDTISLESLYEKLLQSLSELSEDLFPQYLALANDECAKLEKLVAEMHIRSFETADAETIKKLVSVIINLQNGAKEFRTKLTELAEDYNNRAANKISVMFSKCFLVNPEIATEVGGLKFDRIAESIASHTVFTGILSTDIKNLEIYYRCIVMFFEWNRQKYDFLMASAEKFNELAQLLESGKYSAIKGTTTIGDRLKGAAYDFFQESLKDHDDDDDGHIQTESVVILESETVDITELMDEGNTPEENDSADDTAVTEDIQYEDLFSSSDSDPETTSEEESDDTIVYEDITSDSLTAAVDTENDDAAAAEIAEETPNETSQEDSAETSEEVEEAEEAAVNEASEETPAEEASEDAEGPSDDAIVFENPEDYYEKSEEIPIEDIVETTVVFDTADVVNFATHELEDVIVDVDSDEAVETAEIADDDIGATKAIDAIKENTVSDADIIEDEPVQTVERIVTKHKKNYGPFVAILLIIVAIAGIVALKVVPPKLKAEKYYQASQHAKNKEFDKAALLYGELEDYADSELNAKKCKYAHACVLESEGKYDEAKAIYLELNDYYNSKTKVTLCTYNGALADLDAGKYDDAINAFKTIIDYSDSAEQVNLCTYQKALSLIDSGDYTTAVSLLESLDGYMSSSEKILEAKYKYVKAHMDANDEITMSYIKELVDEKYLDSAALRRNIINPDNPTASDTTAVDTSETAPDATQADVTTATTEAAPTQGGVRAYVNYSQSDKQSAETKVDGSKKLYFHVDVTDPQYYGKNLEIYYKTSVGYSDTGAKVKFDKNSTSHVFEYSSTFADEYTIQFELRDENGKAIATQKVSVN